MERLVNAYNPAAAAAVMCRNTISIGWDGLLYDCDFNQMLDLPVAKSAGRHVRDFDLAALNARPIVLGPHCFGCTAGAGSSCGGATAPIRLRPVLRCTASPPAPGQPTLL